MTEEIKKAEENIPVAVSDREPETNYEELYKNEVSKNRDLNDYILLSKEYPEMREKDPGVFLEENPRYIELRNLGLSEKEAYRAVRREGKKEEAPGTTSLYKGSRQPASSMTKEEYALARAVFGEEMTDERIFELYARAKKK